MSLKIIKTERGKARIILLALAAVCLAMTWFFIKWNFVNIVALGIDTKRTESKPVVDWLTKAAPDDPQAHGAAARVFERTFDAGDLERSLKEYEMAVALSPNNYLRWLDLGKARSMNGDMDGSLAAYERALKIAPNYSAVQWACGNSLVRQDRISEGFSLIGKAATSNPIYAEPAVQTALQVFDGDVAQVRQGLGNTDITNAALATVLVAQNHFDAAFDAWSNLSAGDKTSKFTKLGENLIEKFAAAKRFQLAAKVAIDVRTNEFEKPRVGQVSNGGFENGVKLRDAGLFEWQIAAGAQPHIVLNDQDPHGGKYALWIMFNSFETVAFRSVSQTVAVVPGAEYEFEAFYWSEVKTSATLKWEIASALTSSPLASTPSMQMTTEWTPLHVRFLVPQDCDGIVIRLVREGCSGPSCPINGDLALDDFSLKRL